MSSLNIFQWKWLGAILFQPTGIFAQVSFTIQIRSGVLNGGQTESVRTYWRTPNLLRIKIVRCISKRFVKIRFQHFRSYPLKPNRPWLRKKSKSMILYKNLFPRVLTMMPMNNSAQRWPRIFLMSYSIVPWCWKVPLFLQVFSTVISSLYVTQFIFKHMKGHVSW